MNLDTRARHGLFEDRGMVERVAARLADPGTIRRSRQFPYPLLAASLNVETDIPPEIRAAVEQAAEHACGTVPRLPGPVLVGRDASGSMGAAVTGQRGPRATSAMRCVDVAALFASAILRRNPGSVVRPPDTEDGGGLSLVMTHEATTVLDRPTGPHELYLVRACGGAGSFAA